MNSGNPIYGLLGPDSKIFESFFRGSLGEYAARVVHQFSNPDVEWPVSQLLETVSSIPNGIVYDGIAMLQAAMMSEPERLRWGRYMTPYALAVALAEAVPVSDSVVDPTAGIGTLLAASSERHPTRPLGIEPSEALAQLALLAQRLIGDASEPWTTVGDALTAPDFPRSRAMVSSPPWVLRENIPSRVLGRLAALKIYDSLISHELFDLCVPLTVEAVSRYLEEGGNFVASLPSRIETAAEWEAFRVGELFARRGLHVELDFRPPPPPHSEAYPTAYVLCVGRLLERDGPCCGG